MAVIRVAPAPSEEAPGSPLPGPHSPRGGPLRLKMPGVPALFGLGAPSHEHLFLSSHLAGRVGPPTDAGRDGGRGGPAGAARPPRAWPPGARCFCCSWSTEVTALVPGSRRTAAELGGPRLYLLLLLCSNPHHTFLSERLPKTLILQVRKTAHSGLIAYTRARGQDA